MDLTTLSARVEVLAGENATLKLAATTASAAKTADDAKIAELTAALAKANTDNAAAALAAKATSDAALQTLTTQLNAAQAEVLVQTTAATTATAELTALKPKFETATAELTAATAYLKDMAGKALVASGKTVAELPADANVEALTATINTAGVNLANLAALSNRVDESKKLQASGAGPAVSAFKTRP